MSGLFGSFSGTQNATPAATGSLFGTPNTQQPAGGGIFGNPSQNTSQPTTIFGNTNAQQQQQQQQQQPTGGTGLFGNTAQQNPGTGTGAGGGLFGSNTTTGTSSGGLFGNPQTQQQQPSGTGGGLFGNTTTATQPSTSGGLFGSASATNQPSTGGGLFGNTASTTQPGTGGNLFGNALTTQQTTGSGLFGSTPTATQPSGGGGLFGGAGTNVQSGSSTGGLFGSSTTGTSTGAGLFGSKPGGLFGSSTAGTGTGTGAGTGLFGSSTTQTQQPQAGGLFGSTMQPQPSTGLFGGTTQTGTAGSLFGSRPQQSTQGGLFGSTTGSGNALTASMLGSSALLGRSALTPAQQQVDAQTQALKLQQDIETIYEAWNPQSPQCRFQYYFYNLVHPNQVALYGKPMNAKNDALWEKAVRENPDPTCHVPVLAIGFDDLRVRVEAQTKKSEEHQQLLTELRNRIDALRSHHTISNASRLLRTASTQIQLMQRLLRFVQHLHLLIPSVRSSSIRPEEERLRGTLEEIEDELRRGRMKGKLNELWALLGAMNAARERMRNGVGEWAVDEEGMAQLTQVLAEQQTGLALVTKLLQKAMKDVDVIMGNNKQRSDYDVDNLFDSTSTLRASSLR